MFHTTLPQGKHISQKENLSDSKWKGQEQSVSTEPKCKGQMKYYRPRSKDRAYDSKNQLHKTGDNTSI